MDNPNPNSIDGLSFSLEELYLRSQNTFSEHGQHPQLLPSDSLSQGDWQRSAMPFRPSHALQGFSVGLPSATMDRLPAFGQLSLGSNCFSTAYHLHPSALNTRETPYDVGDIEQRGCNFYGSNLGRFVVQGSPYDCAPISMNRMWSSGSSSTLFDGSGASCSQSNQGGFLSSITGQTFDCRHTNELNLVAGNPLFNTLSRFPRDEVEATGPNFYSRENVRERVMKGPIDSTLAMTKKAVPHLLSLLDEGDAVILRNILNGVVHPSLLYSVMKDEHGHRLFIELLDKCGYRHKLGIVSLVAQAGELLDLAGDCYGNSSVKMLIVSVKGLLDLCDIVTSALSIIVSDLMNHDLGLSLIECCLKN
ncbi:uncharacterized protein [Elaeis guineensis]|uniref:uncharacterized protein n=1 Tax=Elaeis guineensis var. tenera TaxID=51953 RepID=UPI003C6D269E